VRSGCGGCGRSGLPISTRPSALAMRKCTLPLAVSSKNSKSRYGSSTASPPDAVDTFSSSALMAPSSERS
jgi:hypothetical protein